MGIDEVLVYCVNDGAVMKAWAVDQKIEGTLINFAGDPSGSYTKALGLELDHPGPVEKLGPSRCKRFALYCEDGVVKVMNVSESKHDPAGDDVPDSSCVDNMMKEIKAL